jgi:hypothetical protein
MSVSPSSSTAGVAIEPTRDVPVGPLFSSPQVLFAALAGTPVAGAVALAINLTRARRPAWMRALPLGAAALTIGAALVLDATVSTWSLWLMVPLFAVAASIANDALFGTTHARAPHPEMALAAVGVVVASWVALGVTAGVAGVALGRTVPELRELVFDVATGDAAGAVRFGDGASRADARKVRDALERAGYLRAGLHVTIARPRGGHLVLRVREPAPVTDREVAAARAMVDAVARGLDPPEPCIIGEAVDENDAVLASGKTCR